MLNELYSVSSVLDSYDIRTDTWHDEYLELPKVTAKKPCLRLWLGRDGSICDIDSISDELARSLRKYGNKQSTFPAFNIEPLYRITDKDHIKELEQIEAGVLALDMGKIKSWCTNDNWTDNVNRKINKCMGNKSQELLGIIGGEELPEHASVIELINLASSLVSDPRKSLRVALEECVFAKLTQNDDVKTMFSVLFHRKETDNSMRVFLDLHDWQDYGHPIASEHITKWINSMLLKSTQYTEPKEDEGERDAFGSPFTNPGVKMPPVRLDGFEVILRSMFREHPCHSRYKTVDDNSYPISLENRSRSKKALEWISAQEREGITWRRIDNSEIIFAYPSKLPETPLKTASLFSYGRQEGPAQTEAHFDSISKEFVKTLNGFPPDKKPDYMQIFIIKKIGKGRSKVVFSRNCSTGQLIHAAETWEHGCRNIPVGTLGNRFIPFPLQVSRIINNVWKQDGDLAHGNKPVERMKYYQGIELFLDVAHQGMVNHYLHILLAHSLGLVIYIGNYLHSGKELDARNRKLQSEASALLAVLGLLLYKMDVRKENYMKGKAYQIGQLLKISDELHALYCKVERKGDIPSRLVGSAMYVTANETPDQAIAQLAVRMNPYIAWAKRYMLMEEEQSWKARWYLKLYRDIADELYPNMSNSIRFGDIEKAQLFFGYLASFPQKEAASAVVNNTSEKK